MQHVIADSEDQRGDSHDSNDSDDSDASTIGPIIGLRRRSASGTLPNFEVRPPQDDNTEAIQQASLTYGKQDTKPIYLHNESSTTAEKCECDILRARLDNLQKEHDAEIQFFRDRASQAEESCKIFKRELKAQWQYCPKQMLNQF